MPTVIREVPPDESAARLMGRTPMSGGTSVLIERG